MITLISWIATILSLVGCRFINRLNIKGYYFWVVSNAIWLLVSISRQDWAQFLLWCCYLFYSFDGINKWSKKEVTLRRVK
jgi:hypothetical protein